MAELFSHPTMLDILDSLKAFHREKFVMDKQLFKTVKKGIPDFKDQYPVLTLEPLREEIELIGSGEQFIIQRTINFSVWVNAFKKEDAKTKIRTVAVEFKKAFKPITDDWMMKNSIDNLRPVFNIDFDPEEFNEPLTINNQWVYQYSYPVIFSSYYKYPSDKIITTNYIGSDYEDLLEILFTQTKSELSFKKYFKDVVTPTDLGLLPGLYIGYDNPDTDRKGLTSTENFDANINFQIYDFLATREIALDGHLKNVTSVFDFILKYEDLLGRLELFKIIRVDYGISSFEQSKPVFTTNISTVANFYTHLY